MSKPVYLFSGLGADERVFQNLDLTECDVTFIKWVAPFKDESIVDYAARLLTQITTQEPILIGLSFGGMMAIEVAKLIPVKKVILISSAKTKKEIPFYFRWAGALRLNKLLPARLLKSANAFTYWYFGVVDNSERKMLQVILNDTDPMFLKWAIDKIVHWKNVTVSDNAVHIHGTKDRILPLRYVKADHTIPGGGHFMVWNKADEIAALIKKII